MRGRPPGRSTQNASAGTLGLSVHKLKTAPRIRRCACQPLAAPLKAFGGWFDLVVGPAVQDHRKINYFRPSISFTSRFSLPSTGVPTVTTSEPSFATVSA